MEALEGGRENQCLTNIQPVRKDSTLTASSNPLGLHSSTNTIPFIQPFTYVSTTRIRMRSTAATGFASVLQMADSPPHDSNSAFDGAVQK